MIEPEHIKLLRENLHAFRPNKTYFTPEEMEIAYKIWNGYHAEKHGFRSDTGCSNCRRSIIQGVFKLAAEFK